MRNLLYIFIALWIISIASCNKDCYKSWGKESSIEYGINSFDTVRVSDVFQVYFHRADEYKILIEGGKNVIEEIRCEVENNTLNISNENKCNWVRSQNKDITIHVHTPSFEKVYLDGESDLYSTDTFYCDTFFLMVYSGASTANFTISADRAMLKVNAGTGKFTFKGKTKNSYIYSHGTAFIYEDELEAESSHINNLSSGDVFVWATQTLKVENIERGDIYYKGNPEEVILQDTPDEGQVIPME